MIKPNAYKPIPTRPATATLKYSIAGVETAVIWTDGEVTDSRLSNIFTFDGSSAAHYVAEDGPASFTPHGLDVLPKLSQLCDRVRDRIQKDISSEIAIVDATKTHWKPTPTTPVGLLIASLPNTKKISDIDSLAVFSEIDRARLKELNETLKSNSRQKAKETRAIAARLRAVAAGMLATQNALCDTATALLHKLIEELNSANLAAKAFSEERFDETFLTSTGGELWRALWNAAEAYSNSVAYTEVEFPNTEVDARCVLCQRPLDEAATKRFKVFNSFCKDQSLQIAAKAKAALDTTSNTINTLQSQVTEVAKIEADLDGIL